MGARPRRPWLLEAGVVGAMISELFRFPVLEASATPEGSREGGRGQESDQNQNSSSWERCVYTKLGTWLGVSICSLTTTAEETRININKNI